MIKTYTVQASVLGRDSGLQAYQDIVCNIILEPDNGQGMTMDKFGNLMFTVGDNNVVLFAVGTWAQVTSS